MKKIVEDVESYATTDDKFQLDSAYSAVTCPVLLVMIEIKQ